MTSCTRNKSNFLFLFIDSETGQLHADLWLPLEVAVRIEYVRGLFQVSGHDLDLDSDLSRIENLQEICETGCTVSCYRHGLSIIKSYMQHVLDLDKCVSLEYVSHAPANAVVYEGGDSFREAGFFFDFHMRELPDAEVMAICANFTRVFRFLGLENYLADVCIYLQRRFEKMKFREAQINLGIKTEFSFEYVETVDTKLEARRHMMQLNNDSDERVSKLYLFDRKLEKK